MANPRILKVDGQVQATGISNGTNSGSFVIGSSGSISGSITSYQKVPIMYSGADAQAFQYSVSRTDETEMYNLLCVSGTLSLPGPGGKTCSYWADGADILDPPWLVIARTGRSGSAADGDVGQWFYSDVRIMPNLVDQDPVLGKEPKFLVSGTLEISSGSSWYNAPNVYPNDLKMALGNTPNMSSIGTDSYFFVSGAIASKDGAIRGVSVFSGDVVGSGSGFFEQGISGSLTRLTNGGSFIEAGENIAVTSASNGAVVITGTDTQNTLDQAYDEGGSGVGAKITVDDQPIQLEVAGANQTAMAVTGTVLFGSSSVAFSDHLPPLPGTDVTFFVSGTTSGKDVAGVSVFGGDLVCSGTVLGGSGGNITGKFDIVEISSDTSLGAAQNVVLVDATSAHVTASLPPAAAGSGKVYNVKKIDSSGNSAVIAGFMAETVDGDNQKKISAQYTSITVIGDGTTWHII